MAPHPSPESTAPTSPSRIEVVPVAWLDAGDIVAEHDPALSIEENASTDEWSRVERVERRVVSCRVVVHFEDGSRAVGYPEQSILRAVAL
ncbi:hypothetical protein WCD74_11630 [Actinomycetospora sp. OC33-EN08]|uniref:Uncharacterized protein n=1 Tax=Actinomycetospora aurantiaca TaxID=3129233 RepID=A0ABU8MPT8_9PSEU